MGRGPGQHPADPLQPGGHGGWLPGRPGNRPHDLHSQWEGDQHLLPGNESLDCISCYLAVKSLNEFCYCGVWFQVEPNTKLFPAVFVQPTNQNLVQLELGKLKVRDRSTCCTSFTQCLYRNIHTYLLVIYLVCLIVCDCMNVLPLCLVSEHHAHLSGHVSKRA